MCCIGFPRAGTCTCLLLWIIHFLSHPLQINPPRHLSIIPFVSVLYIFPLCIPLFLTSRTYCLCPPTNPSIVHPIHHQEFPFSDQFTYVPFPLRHQSSVRTSISASVPLSFHHARSSILSSHPPLQLLQLRRRRRPGPGPAPDRDGRCGAAPGRYCAGRHQPTRHDR